MFTWHLLNQKIPIFNDFSLGVLYVCFVGSAFENHETVFIFEVPYFSVIQFAFSVLAFLFLNH